MNGRFSTAMFDCQRVYFTQKTLFCPWVSAVGPGCRWNKIYGAMGSNHFPRNGWKFQGASSMESMHWYSDLSEGEDNRLDLTTWMRCNTASVNLGDSQTPRYAAKAESPEVGMVGIDENKKVILPGFIMIHLGTFKMFSIAFQNTSTYLQHIRAWVRKLGTILLSHLPCQSDLKRVCHSCKALTMSSLEK